MKAVLFATFSLMIGLSASAGTAASVNPTRVYLVTNPDAHALGCPALVVGTVQTKPASNEISFVQMNLESGLGGESSQFRHVQNCISAAPCDSYDVGAVTMDDGLKMTLMFRHNTDRKGAITPGYAELTALTATKTCYYSLTDMGPAVQMPPLD